MKGFTFMENNEEKKNVKANKKGILFGALALVVIIALIGVIVFLLNRPKEEPTIQETPDGRGVVVTKDNVNEVFNSEPVADGLYETAMNVDWDFQNWQSGSDNAYIENSTSNSRTVYFDLNLKDTQKLIYSSPYIPVGSVLTGDNIKLTEKLEKGDYEAVVTYHLVDDNNEEISTVSVNVTLHILN
jgi:hypothetical protein